MLCRGGGNKDDQRQEFAKPIRANGGRASSAGIDWLLHLHCADLVRDIGGAAASRAQLWRELSSGLVMVGFAMLLAQFQLSGRFRQISGRVGIDLTMRFHQLAAVTVLRPHRRSATGLMKHFEFVDSDGSRPLLVTPVTAAL